MVFLDIVKMGVYWAGCRFCPTVSHKGEKPHLNLHPSTVNCCCPYLLYKDGLLGCKTPSLLQNWGLQGVCKDSTSGVKWTPVAIVANTPTLLLPLCHCSCCNVILFMRIQHTPAYTYKHSVKFKNFDWTDSRLFYKRAVTGTSLINKEMCCYPQNLEC